MTVESLGEEALVYKTPNLVIVLLKDNICSKQSNCLIFHSIPFCFLKEEALL